MKKLPLIGLLLFALIFTTLFYDSFIAINLALFNLLCLVIAIVLQPTMLKTLRFRALAAALIMLSVAMAWHASEWTTAVNILALGLLGGLLSNPKAASFLYIAFQALENIPGIFRPGPDSVALPASGRRNVFSRTISTYSIYVVPLFIILFFVLMYSRSNKLFGNLVEGLINKFDGLMRFIDRILPNFDFQWLFLFFIGILLARFFFQGIRNSLRILGEHLQALVMQRKKGVYINRHTLGLKREYKAGIFLFFMLNLVLLVLNYLDLVWVWLGFKWNGQLMREFVHEGTWMLILSILVGAGLVLYFFRDNINFYTKNRRLKILAQCWIWQNAFLAVSVVIRNWHYVEFYGLAYKRIGVFFFCSFIFLLLMLVSLKVFKRLSGYAFSAKVFASAMAVIMISAPWDWSTIIVKYNLGHADKSFVHFGFLEQMPARCLPLLRVDQAMVEKVKSRQLREYSYEGIGDDGEMFESKISMRIRDFLGDFPRQKPLEWTLADQKAYDALKYSVKRENPER